MDRFEEEQAVLDGAKKINLHSSMDRFEAFAAHRFISRHPIYIPVWIDLKIVRDIARRIAKTFTFQYG